MSSCCACCCFYPNYKRKVDNIYPRNLDSPLIKNEVDKLQYYVQTHPEKLSKIGDYLYQNLKWGLSGSYKNRNYVKNTCEAVEKILLVITPQNLNYYASNYLKIIQKLLEQGSFGVNNQANSSNPNNSTSTSTTATSNVEYLEYQKLAANLFKKFCEKEASNLSTSTYTHLDSFVCQFSSMCFNNNKDEHVRAEIRSSGLQCLATMVKKLVPDDNLRAGYLWDNMDKIVPALLFIMHEKFKDAQTKETVDSCAGEMINLGGSIHDEYFYDLNSQSNHSRDDLSSATGTNEIKIQFKSTHNDEASAHIHFNNQIDVQQQKMQPYDEAKMLLKSLACKADFTTISKIIVPILAYLDDNKNAWFNFKFIQCVFLIIMYNVKQQHAIVIKELIKHLDSHRNSEATLKCQLIKSIYICIRVAAMLLSIGTAGQIIEIFTNLLKHLNYTVERTTQLKGQLLNRQSSKTDQSNLNKEIKEQEKLENEIITAMSQFTTHLPDYAKNDVIMFIAHQINSQQFTYADLNSKTGSINRKQVDSSKEHLNTELRAKYFDCLYEICSKYKPAQLFSAFTSTQFLEDILRLCLVSDWSSRRKASQIIQLLFDKYQILSKIKELKPSLFEFTQQVVRVSASNVSLASSKNSTNQNKTRNQTYLSQLDLKASASVNRTSREDISFMRKHSRLLLAHLNESLFIANNRRENYESIYLIVSLLIIGFFNEKEFLVDFIRFGFHVQELALLNHEQKQFTFALQCNVHKFLCAFFLILSKASGLDKLFEYCSEICDLRRKTALFRYVYPEYILLESSVNPSEPSGISPTQLETDFKHDLKKSAQDYTDCVQNRQKSKSNASSQSNLTSTVTSSSQTVADLAMSSWLFNKKVIAKILEEAGLTNFSDIFTLNSEFSLSSSYLQQVFNMNQAPQHQQFQSALYYRNPHSTIIQSLSSTNVTWERESSNTNAHPSSQQQHQQSIGFRNSGVAQSSSTQQLNGAGLGAEVRYSIDSTVQSNADEQQLNGEDMDDDNTSYDSTSQISVDQYSESKFFLNGTNSTSSSTYNILKQQAQQQNINIHDLSSFETLKRVLFNVSANNNNNNNNQSMANTTLTNGLSGVANLSTAASTVGAKSSSVHHDNSRTGRFNVVHQTNASGLDQLDNNNRSSEENLKIINDFKQKPFDELKQTLMRSNQIHLNSEKYKQVVDLINKELVAHPQEVNSHHNHHQHNHQRHHAPGASRSSSNLSLNENLKANSNTSFNNSFDSSNQSTSNLNNQNSNSANMNALINQTKMIPLNDIEFPKLFMY